MRRRPARLRGLLLQALVLAIAGGLALGIVLTAAANLRIRGIPVGFGFLQERAGFSIAESVLSFDRDDSNARAVVVGIGNTLFVSFTVIVASTILGTLAGLARLSVNPLLAGLARAWVEVARNTPLVLVLIFLYALWWQVLPVEAATELAPGVLASIRGIALPRLQTPWPGAPLAFCLVGASVLVVARAAARRRARATGIPPPYVRQVFIGLVLAALAAIWLGRHGIAVVPAAASGADLVSGTVLTPEICTILIGLVFYTVGFVAEIIRTGIRSVPRGQWEAARSLGLPPRHVLGRIVIPQMLRVILPPMTSQYINVVKNSTLALAVGYSDFMTVMGTIINKTSHAIEGTVIIVLVYLSINLAMSALLNWYNRRAAIPGR